MPTLTLTQDDLRLLIKDSLTGMRNLVDSKSSTMLRGELKAGATRILALSELIGASPVEVTIESCSMEAATLMVSGMFPPDENAKAVDELFTQKGV